MRFSKDKSTKDLESMYMVLGSITLVAMCLRRQIYFNFQDQLWIIQLISQDKM